MKRSLLGQLPLLTITFVFAACGAPNETPSSEPAQQTPAPSAASGDLGMPDESNTTVVTADMVAAGTYKVSKIQSYTVHTATGAKGKFVHTMTKQGEPTKGDTTERTVEWGTLDKEKAKISVTAEINLPLSVEAQNGTIAFKDKRYYWNQLRSDGGWSWRITSDGSPDGVQFHTLVDTANLSGKSYKKDGVRLLIETVGNTIVFSYELKDSTGAQVVQVTYNKQ